MRDLEPRLDMAYHGGGNPRIRLQYNQRLQYMWLHKQSTLRVSLTRFVPVNFVRFCTVYQPSGCCVFDSPSIYLAIQNFPEMRCNLSRTQDPEYTRYKGGPGKCVFAAAVCAHGAIRSEGYSSSASHENRRLPHDGMGDCAFLGSRETLEHLQRQG